MEKITAANVDRYIESFPAGTQAMLREMRKAITTAAPGGEESIAYGMPAYKVNKKPLVYFGGFEKHIGFYATPTGHAAFKEALAKFKQGKGSVQFPLNEKLPLKLVKAIVRFRLQEVLSKNQ